LDDLRIRVPSDTSGNLALVVALVGNDGAALAERSVALRITPRFAAAPRDLALPQERTVAAPALAQATLLAEQGDRSLAQGHVAEAREHFTRAIDLVVSQFQRPTIRMSPRRNALRVRRPARMSSESRREPPSPGVIDQFEKVHYH